MELRELGELLRQEREAKGLSVDDITEKTKISRRNILAIESGNRDELPHAVYSKGFIKNYARLLGVDMEVVEQVLVEAFPAEDEPDEDSVQELKKDLRLHSKARKRKSRSRMGWIVLLVLLGLLAGVLWLVGSQREAQESPSISQTAPSASPAAEEQADAVLSVPEVTSSEESTAEKNPVVEDAVEAESVMPDSGSSVDAPVGEDRAPEEGAGPEDVSDVGELGAASLAEVAEKPVKDEEQAVAEDTESVVTLKAVESCWLKASADGEKSREYYLKPGQSMRLEFSDTLNVRLGNGGGVKVFYEGKDIPTGVASGQVKTLSFP